jgi:hypothetical protein
MNRYFVTLIASGLLAGCATDAPPPLSADDPANPSAPEAPGHATPDALGIDGLTRKSRQILAQVAKEQQDQSGPDAGDQKGQEMKSMPNMQPSQQQQMPGMQMPGMQIPQGQPQPSPTPDN